MISASPRMPTSLARLLPSARWLDTWACFALICLASTVPLLVVDFPPLTDLYGHLGRYAVQTDLANRPALQPYYSYDWQLIGNLGADLLVEVLHPLLGLEPAVRFIVILTQFLAAAGILLISKEIHGRITPFAIAALPLIYGLPFNFGFLNFSLSMALAMLAFVAWLRLRRGANGIAARAWLGLGGAAIWVCHTFGWAFLGLLCGSYLLAEMFAARKNPLVTVRTVIGECWPLLLPVVPMLLWRTGAGGIDADGWALTFKLKWFVSAFRTKWVTLDVASLIFVVFLIYWAIRHKTARLSVHLGIAMVVILVCFLALPVRVFGSAYADMRLLPYGLIVALLAISTRGLSSRAIQALNCMAMAFFAVRMLATGAAYVQTEVVVNEALPALAEMPEGSRVLLLYRAACLEDPEWQLPVLSHMGGVALARRNVFVNDQWQAPGLNPLVVHYKPAAPFDRDPSQLVHDKPCSNPAYPSLNWALDNLPRAAFTHVWILGRSAGPAKVPDGLTPIPNAGSGELYRIEPTY